MLDLKRSAGPDEIKRAFKKAALKHHPDVAEEDDGGERFREISYAYEVLSDGETKGIYDREGHGGLSRRGAQPQGKAEMFWEEFKPAPRAGAPRKHMARDAAAAFTAELSESDGESGGNGDAPRAVVVGSVVEFPLRWPDGAGHTHGVGFVVGRNAERGDVETLPPEARTTCEVEPLWQPADEECSATGCWMIDELESAAYAQEEDLRVLTAAYTRGKGVGKPEYWHVLSELSAHAGSPDGVAWEVVDR